MIILPRGHILTKILTPATFSQKYFNQQLHSISFCGIWCLGQIFVQPNYRAFPSMLLTWTFVILSNIWGVDHFFKVLRKIVTWENIQLSQPFSMKRIFRWVAKTRWGSDLQRRLVLRFSLVLMRVDSDELKILRAEENQKSRPQRPIKSIQKINLPQKHLPENSAKVVTVLLFPFDIILDLK